MKGSRPIYLGKKEFSKKRERVGKLISLFGSFQGKMNYVSRKEINK